MSGGQAVGAYQSMVWSRSQMALDTNKAWWPESTVRVWYESKRIQRRGAKKGESIFASVSNGTGLESPFDAHRHPP